MAGERILIAEDEEVTSWTLEVKLKELGFDVIGASTTGNGVVAMARDLRPDLVLMDIILKGERDGISAADEIKGELNIPVVYITAHASPDTVERACITEPFGYIIKPFTDKELRSNISMALHTHKMESKLKEANMELERLTNIDALTGIGNRRYFDNEIRKEWRLSVRYKRSISLILIDIDYFKLYNDTYGHVAGDACLKAVAGALNGALQRPGDTVARYGGEEFAILLCDTPLRGAALIAERIKQVVTELDIKHDASNVSEILTISIGVSSLIPEITNLPKELIEASDKALYKAKADGRDHIVVKLPEL